MRHSNIFYATVHDSINAVDEPASLPSEFEQMEERITELNQHPRGPAWMDFGRFGTPDSGRYEASAIPLPSGGGGELVMYLQEVNVIKVLDRAEYDELPQKDPRTPVPDWG
ncbi:MAG: hypothetical protein ACLSB9_25225 [Hydrogeniiclostridium mannosilyticum]